MSSKVIDADRTHVAGGDPRQVRAVARMLERADAAAARGDYVDALAWLDRVDAIGDGLDAVYQGRREAWGLRAGPVGPSQWFG